jgi:hypothetical protein
MKALGICCGASTITIVELERKIMAVNVIHVASRAHDGNPKKGVADLTAPTHKKISDYSEENNNLSWYFENWEPVNPGRIEVYYSRN